VSRPDLADLLPGRGTCCGTRQGLLAVNARSMLVVGQVALSMVLLIGAALLMESFARLRGVNPGFQAANLLTMKIALPLARYDADPKKAAFFEELVRRVNALPDVRAAAVSLSLPTTTNNLGTNVAVDGQPKVDSSEQPIAQLQSISPGYFHTLGIPLRRGREFGAGDNSSGARPVIVISESFARRFWPEYPRGLDPVGQHMFEGADRLRSAEIVGIAADVHERGLASDPEPEFYVPTVVHPPQTAYLAVRTDRDPLRLVNSVRDQVWAVDRDQPVSDIRTMDAILDLSQGQRRLTVVLLEVFATVALLLALVGIYGVTAYSVAQRTQEVGIRRALGAQRGDILRLVIAQGLVLALSGVVLGIAGAFALTRVLEQFLFQVSATDPVAFGGIALVFIGVALAASLIPARRAARVDPMAALRIG
jgi:putative ABC transport system permease protein